MFNHAKLMSAMHVEIDQPDPELFCHGLGFCQADHWQGFWPGGSIAELLFFLNYLEEKIKIKVS